MAKKKTSFFVLVLAVIPFFCYPLHAQGPEASKSKHDLVGSTSPGTEKTAPFPTVSMGIGKADFTANCAKCHGGNAKTNARRALLLKIDPKKLYLNASEMNKEEMVAIIEKGKNQMPGFEKQLTKEQITAIVDYVMDLKKKD